MNEIAALVRRYHDWLRDRTVLREVKDWIEITTPYVDRHNDTIQIYARRVEGGFLLSDDGYTIADLAQSGCSLDTPKRKELLRTTLNGFGVRIEDGALVVHATEAAFPLRKHCLIQAILAVNDLFYVASPTVMSLFQEDVAAWLDLSEIRYLPKVKFTGASGFDHVFDFAIPRSRLAPERLIRAVGSPTRDKAESFAFAWHDTGSTRPAGSVAFALLNDGERPVPVAVADALRNYGIEPVSWGERESARERLVA